MSDLLSFGPGQPAHQILDPGVRMHAPSGGGAAAPSPLLIHDEFTDANGTLLMNHVIAPVNVPGNSWELASIQLSGESNSSDIQNNQARTFVLFRGVVVDSGIADAQAEVEWTPKAGANNRNSVLVRYVSNGNMWGMNVREPNSDINIHVIVNGSTTTRASVVYPWAEGQTYTLRLVANGTILECFVDGVSVLSYGQATNFLTATKHGIMQNGGDDDTRWDNFKVSTL